jgi:hypothetical protein
MKLGYTQLNQYRECPRKFCFGQVLQYQPLEVPAALETGLFVHSAISAKLKGNNPLQAINQSLNTTLGKLQTIQDNARRNKAEMTTCDNAKRAIALADRYCEFYLKDYESIAIEPELTFNNVVCHPDLICKYQGNLTIVDFKTSRSPDVRWYIHSGQADLYAYVYNQLNSLFGKVSMTVYDVISEDGIFHIEHLPNKTKGLNLYNEIEILARDLELQEPLKEFYPAFWHYDCPNRCAYYQPCTMLEENNPDGCMELLEKNFEKRYFRDNG